MANFIERMANFNSMSFEMIDSLTDYQIKRMRVYTDLMVKRVNDFSNVNNPAAMKEYIMQQNDFIREMMLNVNTDNKELADLINTYSEKISSEMLSDKK